MEKFDVLFVDDEPDFLESIRTVFDIEGIRAYVARSGEEALKAIEENSFGMIFTDLLMEGMTGIELAGRVRAKFSSLPIYLMTGCTVSPELATLGMKVGISNIFEKPINLSTILAVVRPGK